MKPKDWTMRDTFAVAAMQAWLTAGAFNQEAEKMLHKAGITKPDEKERFIARVAYSMADHMLSVREER